MANAINRRADQLVSELWDGKDGILADRNKTVVFKDTATIRIARPAPRTDGVTISIVNDGTGTVTPVLQQGDTSLITYSAVPAGEFVDFSYLGAVGKWAASTGEIV